MNNEIIDSLFDKIKFSSKLKFPDYETPSIPKEGLILPEEKEYIEFEEGRYNKNSKTLKFSNGDIFKGKLINKQDRYCLKNGKYEWNTGQIFNGEFDENNSLKEGVLTHKQYSYNLNLKQGEFKGKIDLNENDFVDGTFKNSHINGFASVKKDNYIIKGNFRESKPDGIINEFSINVDNHNYQFNDLHFENDNIQENQFKYKKDQQILSYYKIIENETENIEEFIIEDEELSKLESCLNLLNIQLPQYELPTFHNEGLIIEKVNFPIIEFRNGAEANLDEDKDENELIFRKDKKDENIEKFVGILYYKDEDDKEQKEKKYYLKEGKYVWPSGQIYEGTFNENYQFETPKAENSKLTKENEWSYKGQFKEGNFYGKGILEYSDGKKIVGYFDNNKIIGNIIITYNNITLKANSQDSLISGIVVNINGNNYKIKELKLNNNIREVLTVKREDEHGNKKTYLLYQINNGNIKFERIIPKEERDNIVNFFNILNNEIYLPPFDSIALDENSLKINKNKNEKIILFKNDIIYDEEKKLLLLPNKESYKGELIKEENKYYLDSGEYKWPSGQEYKGSFKHYKFNSGEGEKSILTTKNYTYIGGFENGLPKGDGEIQWENGNIIKGKFIDGIIFGETYVKNENISFVANYTYSLISGYIKNIKILSMDKEINNSLNIEKGKIKETIITIDDEDYELNEDKRFLLSEQEYKKNEGNTEEILDLFKHIYRFRRFSLPTYEEPRITEDGIYIENINSLENIQLSFPNEEFFVGNIERITGDKYMLIEGEYNWKSGQKYIGKFVNNRFNDEKAKLIFSGNTYYEGGFENGIYNGNGKFINSNKYIFEGYFEEGEINDINLKSKNIIFEGKNLDSIKYIYIKLFKFKTKEHNYEISEFNIDNKYIIYKRDEIELNIDLSQELKQKIIEILLFKNKTMSNFKKYFYNNRYIKDLSNENRLKILKIENNIYSKKLSKISIYKNKLVDDNRNKINEIDKIVGTKLNNRMTLQDINCRLYSIKNLRKKINSNVKLKMSIKNLDFGEIEKNEISRIFNHKMLKEMKKEIDLLKKDIITLKHEKKIIEKERNNKKKEKQDLNIYFELIANNYNQLTKEKNKIEDETKEMQEKLQELCKENNLLNKYLKNNSKNLNDDEIKRNIKEIEKDNKRILNEINEKEKKINEQNKEKADLLKQIESLKANNI